MTESLKFRYANDMADTAGVTAPGKYNFVVRQGAPVSEATEERPTVLIVDDEEAVADTYALRMRDRYETRVAYGGREALEKIDADVDAVILDRRMPDLSGDDVLEAIREEGYECPVIMTTAVDPDLNILEMDFDDYLCKPLFDNTLVDTLEQHLDTSRGDDRLQEFFSIVSKLSVLEQEMAPTELQASDEYEQLQRRADELEDELRDSVDDFGDIVDTYRDISRGT